MRNLAANWLALLLFAALSIAAINPAAAAQPAAWSVTEGTCYDWRGSWDLNQTGPGTWTGRINYRHVGGNCVAASGAGFSADVVVQISGGTWRAQRSNSSDGNECSYGGTVRGIQLVGTYTCNRIRGGPFNIVINTR